ncbi:MAG: endo-1,4-beta-xylanase [Gemmataceae bacterium]
MIFQLPADLPGPARAELERASVLGGQDNMPFPTQVIFDDQHVMLHRSVPDSGAVLVPWSVPGFGRLMVGSGSLMERLQPYQLPLELARGKVNQLRNQTSDWLLGGLVLTPDLQDAIRAGARSFSQAVTRYPEPSWREPADRALHDAFDAAQRLVHTYMDQVLDIRHQRQNRLDTFLSCRLQPGAWSADHEAAFRAAFNAVVIPMPWAAVEAVENDVHWNAIDDLINWATRQQLHITAGPLIDFSGRGLPDWLWTRDTDLLSLCGYLSDYVGMVVQRYHGLVRSWQITAGSNCAGVLALGDEELLWLTVRLVEAARRVDPNLDISVGVAQPFGDYLVHQERNQSPFAFADNLLRTGLRPRRPGTGADHGSRPTRQLLPRPARHLASTRPVRAPGSASSPHPRLSLGAHPGRRSRQRLSPGRRPLARRFPP